MKGTLILITILLASVLVANGATQKSTINLTLGESTVNVNVYENAGANITFFAPHHNEQTARALAKEYVERGGGRIVEIESFDDKGNAARYLKFTLKGKTYTIDPNRIFTDNGRTCNTAVEINETVKAFAESLLKIIFAPDGKSLRDGERFVVAVHNNTDVDSKTEDAKSNDLTAVAFVRGSGTLALTHGAFEEQADGVFLSNTEMDADNFIFLSTPQYIGHFAEKGFNVVVQKSAPKLASKQCTVDDGSMSVYSALNTIPYICLEADGMYGAYRQRQMFEAIYQLLPAQKPIEPSTVAAK
ncbi:MAG: hypothetical protein WA584_12005 [Pyrinomonadaceae bacterium]